MILDFSPSDFYFPVDADVFQDMIMKMEMMTTKTITDKMMMTFNWQLVPMSSKRASVAQPRLSSSHQVASICVKYHQDHQPDYQTRVWSLSTLANDWLLFRKLDWWLMKMPTQELFMLLLILRLVLWKDLADSLATASWQKQCITRAPLLLLRSWVALSVSL